MKNIDRLREKPIPKACNDIIIVAEYVRDLSLNPFVDRFEIHFFEVYFFVENVRPIALLDELLVLILEFHVLLKLSSSEKIRAHFLLD